MNNYRPSYLSWCNSYEQEVTELRDLIIASPADVAQLRREYQTLTGKRFRRKKDE